jgi:hypothetical protein
MQDDDGRLVEAIAKAICCPNGCHIVRINERAETAQHYDSPWPCCWQQKVETVAAALCAIEREGWKVVPVEPTEEMVQATPRAMSEGTTREAWTAMLDAAPKP